ncbi:MAG TPA: phosphoribosyl-ATP diphosphatase [Geobacterales bacterium]|jgi:phosphoribosyl-ATP pyrophosphohydrolase|nr:phosphoribosyl-ATP diphosphatase [Geobacterales bacterium]
MCGQSDIIDQLYDVILERKANPSVASYTTSLLSKGIDKILKKVGEEGAELIIAGKGGKREEIVYESADLIYHLLVLLAHYEIQPEELFAELRRRQGTSGLEEKRQRGE